MHREAESREEAQTKGHADERGDERVAALDRAPIEQRTITDLAAEPGDHVRVEAVVSDAVGEAIVTRLAERYFANYAVIAWLTEVSVVRGEKYLRS